ncbi:MAG TPA: zf-HC2 domain-containing protein [Myxococcota bacterium]|nr:zf-HC2 domain-containing protein [Myxococcota bacterium]
MESVPETCRPYDEDLSALLDGELPSARAAQLRAHCDSCPRCAAQLAELRQANERVLSALRAAVPGEGARIARVEARLRARLAEEGPIDVHSRQSRTPAAPPRQRNGRWIVAAGMGLAAAAALGLTLLFQARTPARLAPTPPPRIAQNPPPVPPLTESPQKEPPAATRVPEAVAELPAAKPAPTRPRPPAPPVPQPEQLTPPLPSAQPEIDLAAADEEDVELASRLDMLEDFEVIQKLDLLERLRKAEDGAGSG